MLQPSVPKDGAVVWAAVVWAAVAWDLWRLRVSHTEERKCGGGG